MIVNWECQVAACNTLWTAEFLLKRRKGVTLYTSHAFSYTSEKSCFVADLQTSLMAPPRPERLHVFIAVETKELLTFWIENECPFS